MAKANPLPEDLMSSSSEEEDVLDFDDSSSDDSIGSDDSIVSARHFERRHHLEDDLEEDPCSPLFESTNVRRCVEDTGLASPGSHPTPPPPLKNQSGAVLHPSAPDHPLPMGNNNRMKRVNSNISDISNASSHSNSSFTGISPSQVCLHSNSPSPAQQSLSRTMTNPSGNGSRNSSNVPSPAQQSLSRPMANPSGSFTKSPGATQILNGTAHGTVFMLPPPPVPGLGEDNQGTVRQNPFGSFQRNAASNAAAISMANNGSNVDKTRLVNGSFKLRRIVAELATARAKLKAYGGDDMSDTQSIAQSVTIQTQRQKLEAAKMKACKQILEIGDYIHCEGEGALSEVKTQVIALVGDLFVETDQRPGNTKLMTALSRVMTVQMPLRVIRNGWLTQCARDGSHEYLDLFLTFPEVQDYLYDDVDRLTPLMTHCLRNNNNNKKARLFGVLAKHAAKTSCFQDHTEELAPTWQKGFEAVAIKPPTRHPPTTGHTGGDREMEREEKATKLYNEGRQQALAIMLAHPNEIRLNFMRVSPTDNMTVFSRSCRDGDVWLVSKMLASEASAALPGTIVDINHVSSDGSTALMQALVKNQREVVTVLLESKRIDLHKKHPVHGTALDIALKRGEMHKLDQEILLDLQAAFRKEALQAKTFDEDEETAIEKLPVSMLTKQEIEERKRKIAKAAAREDGSASLRSLLQGTLPQFEKFVRLLIESGHEPKIVRDAAEHLERAKINLVQKIRSISHNAIFLRGVEESRMLIRIVDCTILADEKRPGSIDFLKAIMHTVDLAPRNWVDVCIEKDWLSTCAKTSSSQFLKILLTELDMCAKLPTAQLVETVKTISENQLNRIPLMKTLLMDCELSLKLGQRSKELAPLYQQFFADVASTKRALKFENREDRLELLSFMLDHDHIPIDLSLEEPAPAGAAAASAAKKWKKKGMSRGAEVIDLISTSQPYREYFDGLNIFVRAADEGDIELLKIFVLGTSLTDKNDTSLLTTATIKKKSDEKKTADNTIQEWLVQNVNKPVAMDGTNALMRAAANGHTSIVELLVKSGGANPHFKTSAKKLTAMEIAKMRAEKEEEEFSMTRTLPEEDSKQSTKSDDQEESQRSTGSEKSDSSSIILPDEKKNVDSRRGSKSLLVAVMEGKATSALPTGPRSPRVEAAPPAPVEAWSPKKNSPKGFPLSPKDHSPETSQPKRGGETFNARPPGKGEMNVSGRSPRMVALNVDTPMGGGPLELDDSASPPIRVPVLPDVGPRPKGASSHYDRSSGGNDTGRSTQ